MNKSGFYAADILIPKNADLTKWSVVACDQYTSELDYWEKVESFVGNSPSTLKLTLPEIYLENDDTQKRIFDINKNMKNYLDSGIFRSLKDSLIYVERTQRDGKQRRGLIGAVDLELYDYNKGSQSLIRATEGTILDRLPPRIKVRENACLELPHIMLLIDDRENKLFDNINSQKNDFDVVYDFDLMQNSGHIKGSLLNERAKTQVISNLNDLSDKNTFDKKYGVSDYDVLLFAVGDGNHSLATAKECYEQNKKNLPPKQAALSRYALVELVNLHDNSLEFEPIHRVVFDVDRDKFFAEFEKQAALSYSPCSGQKITAIYGNSERDIYINKPSSNIPVGSLQNFIDDYIAKNGGKVDYIHGDDVVKRLARDDNNIGFLLPVMDKNELFKTVILDGALPRKTFSMGHACDKRFYLECKKIR